MRWPRRAAGSCLGSVTCVEHYVRCKKYLYLTVSPLRQLVLCLLSSFVGALLLRATNFNDPVVLKLTAWADLLVDDMLGSKVNLTNPSPTHNTHGHT